MIAVDGDVLERADGGGRPGTEPEKARPPLTRSSLHTSFFIACSGLTQEPPDSLQPGAPATENSRSRSAAVWTASFTAPRHSEVM